MEIKCVVVTPEKVVLEKDAEFVALPLYDGEYGIAFNHTPVIGRLGAGELRIRKDGNVDSYYVAGGFVEVLNNNVTLMTSRAVPVAQKRGLFCRRQVAFFCAFRSPESPMNPGF